MCISIFSTTFVWYICQSRKKWARYDDKRIRVLVFKWSAHYSSQILMELQFYWHIFEKKICKCKILWKSVQWGPGCSMRTDGRADGWTDRQTDMTKLIVAFRNLAKAHKNDAHSYLRFTLGRKYFRSVNHSGQLRSNVFTWNIHCDTQITALLSWGMLRSYPTLKI
jgi:hypothetical protein